MSQKNKSKGINNPLVFITGASSGIGQALAWEFYQRGYRLALVARRTDCIQKWVQEQKLDGNLLAIYQADVAIINGSNGILEAAKQCILQQGVPDVVIANAGISIGIDSSLVEDLPVLQQIYAVNNFGLAATFQPFIAAMCKRGSGCLVGIASVAGIRGLPGHGGYCSSKAAVIGYCESLRGELHGTGVGVTVIAPGYVDTPLTRDNPYAMPFIMSAQDFAALAYKNIIKGKSYCVIPWQMAWVSRILKIMPNWLFDRLLHGRGRKPRQSTRKE